MTALAMPSFERRLFQTMKEEVEAKSVREWPRESVDLSLDLLRKLRETTARKLRSLQEALAEGVEARSFARDGTPLLEAAENFAASIRELADKLSSSEGEASRRILAELHLLEAEEKAFRSLLMEAVSLAARPSPPVDWDRIHSAEEAYARGETKPFYRR